MKASTILFVAVAISQMGATDCGQVLRDPGFDLWCGEELCAWKTERGAVKKVPTWNEGDPGVELVGEDVAIEQLSPVTSGDGSCIEFDLIANVDENSQVELNVDIFGDGTIEHMQPIPVSNWAPLAYRLPITGSFQGIRFEITKRGTGTAVIAQVGAKEAPNGCGGFSPIIAPPAPDGALCQHDADCANNKCTGSFCASCDATSCGAGSSCGAVAPTSPVLAIPRACVANGSAPLGASCYVGAECASGICTPFTDNQLGTWGACSECDASKPCTNGNACGPATWDTHNAPNVCGAAKHAKAAGAACAQNDECASNNCNGTARMQCNDGRACGTAITCPFADLENTGCDAVGVQGGSCE